MTEAQKRYLWRCDIDPWTLKWSDACEVGFPDWGTTEAARLPDGRILLADGYPRDAANSQASTDE